MFTFTLGEEETKKFLEWKETLPKREAGAIGGAFTFFFTPTGLGTITKVKYFDDYELDLTDDNW